MNNSNIVRTDQDEGAGSSSDGFHSIDLDEGDFFDTFDDLVAVEYHDERADFRFNQEVEIFPRSVGEPSIFVRMNFDGTYYYNANQYDINEDPVDEPTEEEDDDDADQHESDDTPQEEPTNPEAPASNMIFMGAIEKGFQRVFGGTEEDEQEPVVTETASSDATNGIESDCGGGGGEMAAEYVLYDRDDLEP